jgi:predicted Zn-dependent protease
VSLGLFLAGGCAVNPVTGQSELMLVSESQEMALGREAYPTLRWQDGGPLQLDRTSQAYLASIVSRLHGVSHRPNLPVAFTLQSASVPNAWAIPGHTAMNRGLLQSIENEAQFAFVMGHEMGHVSARHTAKRQTYALLGTLFVAGGATALEVTGGGNLGQLALAAASAGTSLLLLHYDREQELEADQLGALYMARAGYDPRESIRAHDVLERSIDQYLANIGKAREQAGPISDLLSTHPRHEVRVADLEQYIQTIPAADRRIQADGRLADRWLRQTAGIRALAPAYAHYDRAVAALAANDAGTADRELAEAVRLGDQAPFATLQGGLAVTRQRHADAQQAFQRALSRHPGYQPAFHGLGTLDYARGRDASALPSLQESLRLRPGYVPSEYVMGLVLARQGRSREAIPYLKATAAAVPGDASVNGLLARQYEQTGDTRAALLSWQAQVKAAPESELGRQGRERVRVLATSVVEPYVNADARLKAGRPLAWEVTRERRLTGGGEFEWRRQDPPARLWVVSVDYGTPQGPRDVEVRLDEQVRSRLAAGASLQARVTATLGGRPASGRDLLARGQRDLLLGAARGSRVYWIEVEAEAGVFADPALRGEIQRILDSFDF